MLQELSSKRKMFEVRRMIFLQLAPTLLLTMAEQAKQAFWTRAAAPSQPNPSLGVLAAALI